MNGVTMSERLLLAENERAHAERVRALQDRIAKMSDAMRDASEQLAIIERFLGPGTGYKHKQVAQDAAQNALRTLRRLGY